MSSTIYGVLGIEDRDTTVETVGQSTTYEAINELVARHNEEVNGIIGFAIETVTTEFQQTYETPGGGEMQEADELTRPDAVSRTGDYTVAYDLRDFRDAIEIDDIAAAYMTLNKLQADISSVMTRHMNVVRKQILKHLLNNANETFYDKTKAGGAGDLTIRRLANSDSTTYAPIIGSDTGADDNHYLVSGYAASAISDSNDPFATAKEEIEEHFDRGEHVAFINPAQSTVVKALTDFVEITRMHVSPGNDTAQVMGAPPAVPGTLIGTINDVWVYEWRRFPANYIFQTDLSQPAPLRKRIDRVAVAGRGELALVATEETFPLRKAIWRDRHGYGAANRLNGVVTQLKASGSYDIPSGY